MPIVRIGDYFFLLTTRTWKVPGIILGRWPCTAGSVSAADK